MVEESLIESFVRALEGTKGTVEFSFDNLSIKLPGMNANVLINGKVNVTAIPVNEKTKQ
ncbi:hypothetical protein [Thermoplasma acidophilum]|uniref:hypothetical protein n=1 Tax=Thermoplasma acidophilum TaxID=2303 RepID=UPI0012E99C6E|nr:hypothetical protein [Thermoplasma acidophilum]MCY0852317.1 hypothetical protein [Thermoplasma acidophilum]